MDSRFQFRSIGARLTFWFFIMAMLPLIMVNIAIYIHMVDAMKVSIFNKIENIRDLKVLEVDHWLDERISDIRTIAVSDALRKLDKIQIDRGKDSQRGSAFISEARNLLDRYVQHFDDLNEIHVISPYSGNVLVSTDRLSGDHIGAKERPDPDVLQSGDIKISDIYYSNRLNKPCMDLSVPVIGLTGDQIIGTLVANINLEASLYKILFNRTGVGRTGETLIVDRDAMALNELRWSDNRPLTLKITAAPAVNAALGRTGIMETRDYRGQETLAAYTYLPRTGWGFVAKQDLDEIYAPIYRLRKWMLAIVVMTLVGVIIVAFRVSRSISNPIKALHKGAEIIGSGDLDHRVGTDADDEIGELSRIFDLMIENLRTTTASWDDLSREMAERRHLEKMLLEIREHEQRRIGHDLHDNLGQQLTAISYKTQGLENTLRKKMIPEVDDAARITSLIEMAKTQVKTLSKGLSPMLEKGEYSFMTAIVDLASHSEKLFGIPCRVICVNPALIYNESALIHLYRIVQEAITNAARHASPDEIQILLNREGENISLIVRDDGRGIDIPKHREGMGLEIMQYRARIINASLDVRKHSEKGTVITCIWRDKRGSRVPVSEIIS